MRDGWNIEGVREYMGILILILLEFLDIVLFLEFWIVDINVFDVFF